MRPGLDSLRRARWLRRLAQALTHFTGDAQAYHCLAHYATPQEVVVTLADARVGVHVGEIVEVGLQAGALVLWQPGAVQRLFAAGAWTCYTLPEPPAELAQIVSRARGALHALGLPTEVLALLTTELLLQQARQAVQTAYRNTRRG